MNEAQSAMSQLPFMVLKTVFPIFLIIFVAIIVMGAIKILIKVMIRKSKDKEIWPYYAKKIMTKPEMILYFRLLNALPEYIVLAQVQLSQVLGVDPNADNNPWYNKISRMSLDFVVCRKEDASIVAAIELDDKSHEWESRIRADKKKDKALTSAGVKIIRWKVKEMPDEKTIKQILAEA